MATKAELEAENAELKKQLEEAGNGGFPARTGAVAANVAKLPGSVKGGSVVATPAKDEESSE